MTAPSKPFDTSTLHNSTQLQRAITNDIPMIPRPSPGIPPPPRATSMTSNMCNSYMPYSSGYNSFGYGNYGNYGGMPYRGALGSAYPSYNNYGMYNMGGGYPNYAQDDAERRFVQYAEESSRSTFANVESIVKAVNSISMMLDNTFFAMTSSFRAVLSVAENFGRLRNMFGHIWQTISLFRLFNWLYRKFMTLLGYKVPRSAASTAWKQASGSEPPLPSGSSWPTLAFLGVLISAPYIINKFLPKYEDLSDPTNWKTPGVCTKAAFDFMARAQNELSIQTNDEVVLAPTTVQEKMGLKNSGWAFAVCNGKSGVVPVNYLLLNKTNQTVIPQRMPVTRTSKEDNGTSFKSASKRVSFGENKVYENVDLEDYITGKKKVDNKTVEETSKKETVTPSKDVDTEVKNSS